MTKTEMPAALARWDDDGGSGTPWRDRPAAVSEAAPLGLYQRASLRFSFDPRAAASAPRGLFAGPPASGKAARRNTGR